MATGHTSTICINPAPGHHRLGIVKIWDCAPYTAPVVWGKPRPGRAAEDQAPPGPLPVSPTRIAAGGALVGALTWALASVVGLGPNLDVVLVAAFGSAGAVRYGRGRRRLAVVTLLAVALVGIGWIEAVNKVQYGTLALTRRSPARAMVRVHLPADRRRQLRTLDGNGTGRDPDPALPVGLRRVRRGPGDGAVVCDERRPLRRPRVVALRRL